MNKIIVSIVFAVILVVGINKITDLIFYVEKPKKSAYQVSSVSTDKIVFTSPINKIAFSQGDEIKTASGSTTTAYTTHHYHFLYFYNYCKRFAKPADPCLGREILRCLDAATWGY